MAFLYLFSGLLGGVLISLGILKTVRVEKGEWLPPFIPIEILSALSFFLVLDHYGFTGQSVFYLVLLSLAIMAAFIDFKWLIIPNRLTGGGFLAGLALLLLARPIPLFAGVSGFLAGGLVMLFLYIVSRGRIGAGDVKYAAMAGLFLGRQYIMAVLLMSFALGALTALVLLAARLKGPKDAIPFGPFISIGIMAVVTGKIWPG